MWDGAKVGWRLVNQHHLIESFCTLTQSFVNGQVEIVCGLSA